MHKILVSYCLLGGKVRYHGGDAYCDNPTLRLWAAQGRIVPLCPEVAAGNPVPRAPSEIVGIGGGAGVMAGTAQIKHRDGEDVTAMYLPGAAIALELAQQNQIQMAILKSGSPSCGNRIYDGSFSGNKIDAMGIVAYWLNHHGIKVFNEDQISDADAYLQTLMPAAD